MTKETGSGVPFQETPSPLTGGREGGTGEGAPWSQPELGTDRIVRFVTKQAPAPQALKFLEGAREGEEGRVLY